MAQDALDIVNLAISKAGGEKVGSLEENTPLAVLGAEDYPHKRRAMLARHRWVFAKRIVQLAQIETPDDCPRAYAFARPTGLVGQVHDYRAGANDDAVKLNVLQLADYLCADTDEVWIEYTAEVPEATWPPWFVDLVVTVFAADVANAKMRRTRAAELLVEAFGNPEDHGDGGLMGIAKGLDSQNAPKRTLEYENGGALVEARLAGGTALNDSRFAAALFRGLGQA